MVVLNLSIAVIVSLFGPCMLKGLVVNLTMLQSPRPRIYIVLFTKIALVIAQQTAVSSKVYLLVRSMML